MPKTRYELDRTEQRYGPGQWFDGPERPRLVDRANMEPFKPGYITTTRAAATFLTAAAVPHEQPVDLPGPGTSRRPYCFDDDDDDERRRAGSARRNDLKDSHVSLRTSAPESRASTEVPPATTVPRNVPSHRLIGPSPASSTAFAAQKNRAAMCVRSALHGIHHRLEALAPPQADNCIFLFSSPQKAELEPVQTAARTTRADGAMRRSYGAKTGMDGWASRRGREGRLGRRRRRGRGVDGE